MPDETEAHDDRDLERSRSSNNWWNTTKKPNTPNRVSMPGMVSDWRKIPLTRIVNIPSIHPHPIILSTQVGANSPKANMARRVREQMSQEEYEDACWQCNGVELFQGGCKGGISDFDLHPQFKVWRCEETVDGEDCDFDLCEVCVRWTMHCERTQTDLGRLL